MDVLLLCAPSENIAATVEDQLQALQTLSKFRYRRLPVKGNFDGNLCLDRFDGLVLHYSLIVSDDRNLSRESRKRISAFHGLKAMFIQDEYRFVNRTIAAIQEMGIDLLFTCVPNSEIEKVYPSEVLPGMRKVNVLTGYVPSHLLKTHVPSYAERPIDVGYRGRSVPMWLGELGQDKWRIGRRFLEDAKAYGMKCDIAYREEDRLYGKAWIDFLCNCKATLGVESGASVFDFTGDIQRQVEEHELRQPHATFEELSRLYFAHLEGKISLNQISPRSFECAALRTVMILYEGEYSGILKPWRHYIPLKKDHSNMPEVVSALKSRELCERLVEQAFREIAENPAYGYEAFVSKVDKMMNECFRPAMAKQGREYSDEEFLLIERRQREGVYLFQFTSRILRAIHFLIFRVLLGWASPERKHAVHLRLRRYYRDSRKHVMEWMHKPPGMPRE